MRRIRSRRHSACAPSIPGARPIAGGTDLMVALNADRERPDALIDLGRVAELRGWRYEGDELVLGAALTYTEASSGEVASALPALAAASRTVGSPQIRNRGTIGGNLGTASPAGDSLPPLLIEDARIELAGTRGERTLPLAEFLIGPKRTALEADELVVAVRLRPSRAPQTFMKVGPRNAMVISICSLALCGRPRARGAARGVRLVRARRRRWSPRRSTRPRASPSASWPRRARSTTCAARPPTVATRSACSRAARSRGASYEDRAARQRRAARSRRLRRREPAVRPARAARAARRQGRLRGGRVRLLLGAARRRARVRLPRARRAGRRARGRDRRGTRRRRAAARGAAGVRRGGRRAVRLLHARPRRRDGRAARARRRAERRRHPRGALGQSLPLHGLRPHLRGRARRPPRSCAHEHDAARARPHRRDRRSAPTACRR